MLHLSSLQAHLGTWLNNVDHIHLLQWGNLRCSLDWLEHKIDDHQGHYNLMIPTWRYMHSKFPSLYMHSMGGQDPPLMLKTGFRYSLDIALDQGLDKWAVERMVQHAFQNQQFLIHGGDKTTLNFASRRSFGHQGKQDAIEACTCLFCMCCYMMS